jgi:hypothetical protein
VETPKVALFTPHVLRHGLSHLENGLGFTEFMNAALIGPTTQRSDYVRRSSEKSAEAKIGTKTAVLACE